jgi:hypothetical protein
VAEDPNDEGEWSVAQKGWSAEQHAETAYGKAISFECRIEAA